ncbi:MAG: hypothetical protein HZB68_00520 [Candidatus Aenigmarchaeota archaeon]|nr:hypothetical protein [Candidatus Aenigmarchaeota archaeon]
MELVFSKHVLRGTAASLLLLAIYFAIVGFLQGIGYAMTRFIELWYLMVPLVAGFGIQIALFSMIKEGMKARMASGGVSAASMVACCAHHITDAVPLLGASALGVLLLQYQSAFLVLGIVSNGIGILSMLRQAKRNGIETGSRFLALASFDMESLVRASYVLGAVAIAAAFILTVPPQPTGITLLTVSKEAGGIVFEARPLSVSSGSPIKIELTANTHSGSIDIDVGKAKLSVDGKVLGALTWDGPMGGHHVKGTLTFPAPETPPKEMALLLDYGSQLSFQWRL